MKNINISLSNGHEVDKKKRISKILTLSRLLKKMCVSTELSLKILQLFLVKNYHHYIKMKWAIIFPQE